MRSAVFSLFVLLLLALLTTACDQPRPVQVVAGAERLPGLYWEPPKPLSRAVLLVHMLGRRKEDWISLATRLRQAGYGVLAIDLREQGRTGAPELLADLRAGFDFLRAEKKVDAARIGLVGASIGANAALNLAAQEPLVRLTALLSPGLNYRGVTTEPALRDYGPARCSWPLPRRILPAPRRSAAWPRWHRARRLRSSIPVVPTVPIC